MRDITDAEGNIVIKGEEYDYLEFYVATYNECNDAFSFTYERAFNLRLAEKLKDCE